MTTTAYLLLPDGERERIDRDRTVIGRSSDADIVLTSDSISRSHAIIERDAGGFVIVDDGSRNGTFVNGDSVSTDPHRLDDGDVIVLGGTLPLTFRDPNATPIAPRIGRLTGVWVDPDTRDVWVDARRLEPPLSPRQLDLLRCLDDADGAIVTRNELVDQVWADVAAAGVSDDALTGLLKRLRSRLDEFTAGESAVSYIEIVRHHGVRLNQPSG